MIGYFIIEEFAGDNDKRGYFAGAHVSFAFDMNIKGFLYLPPYLRQSECNINCGSKVFGVMDDVTGVGVAMYGVDCDIDYEQKADYSFGKSITVQNNITATTGDVKAVSTSLLNHVHAVAGLPCMPPPPAQAPIGTVTGETTKPV